MSNDNCGLTMSEILDTTDKLNMNLSFVKTHLSVVQQLLEEPGKTSISQAMIIAYAAFHFVEMMEKDTTELFEHAKQRSREGQS